MRTYKSGLEQNVRLTSLNVWFPARWVPTVLEAMEEKGKLYRKDHARWFDAPAQADDTARLKRERADALQSRRLKFQTHAMGDDGEIPTLICATRIDWLQLPVGDILQQFGTLKEGICRGVFRQKAAAA